jgi:hypothetical protein
MSNLVLNGSFETFDWTDWTGTGIENDIQHGGINDLNYAHFGNTESHEMVSQMVNTSSGANYVLSYYLRNDGGEPTQYFAASLDGGNTVIQGSVISLTSGDLPEMDWTLYTFNFTATGPTNLSFITQQDPAYFDLTAISIVQYTTPYRICFNKCSLFSDNSMVYYKPNSLSSGSGGSGVRNSRHIQRRT